MARFTPGAVVQTPLGKGVVLEVRNRTVLVRVHERAVLLDAGTITMVSAAREPGRRAALPAGPPATGVSSTGDAGDPRARAGPAAHSVTLDVHGLTVAQALDAVDAGLNDALLSDASELRVIHGRSSNRIRHALHRHLRGVAAVRHTRLDPDNAGVTVIALT